MDWLTLDEARDRWRDAPFDDGYLTEILDVAAAQVMAYGRADVAAAIAADEAVPRTTVPVDYRSAQLAQAKNVWNAVKADPSNAAIGDEGFAFAPVRLDATVKQLIRPLSAKPVVG